MKLPHLLLQSRNDLVGMLAMLYSPDGIQVFSEMANDTFRVYWPEITAEETRALLLLLGVAEQVTNVDAQLLGLMPPVVLQGLTNAYRKLLPYRQLLMDLNTNKVTPYEAKILAGDISLRLGEGKIVSIEELNALLVDVA